MINKILSLLLNERPATAGERFTRVQVATCALLLEVALSDGQYQAAEARIVHDLLAGMFSLPADVIAELVDFARDHQANVQSASRLATEAITIADMDIPIVTDADHMAKVAEILLYNAWRARETVSFAIPAETYYALDPADIVTVTYGGDSHRLRLTKIDYSAPGLMRCEAAFDEAEIYASTATGVSGTVTTQTVTGLGTSVGLHIFHLACYDLDRFRELVFREALYDMIEVGGINLDELRGDDLALLACAYAWLKGLAEER